MHESRARRKESVRYSYKGELPRCYYICNYALASYPRRISKPRCSYDIIYRTRYIIGLPERKSESPAFVDSETPCAPKYFPRTPTIEDRALYIVGSIERVDRARFLIAKDLEEAFSNPRFVRTG